MVLDAQEKQKLHSEVTQLVNQQFILNGVGITLFGVILALVMPYSKESNFEKLTFYFIAASCLLQFLLFVIYLVSHFLRKTIRIYTTYLIEKKASEWEKNWQMFRENEKNKYFTVAKSQAILYLVLMVLATAFPFILLSINSETICINCYFFLIPQCFIFTVLIVGMGFRDWFYNPEQIKQTWKKILDSGSEKKENGEIEK